MEKFCFLKESPYFVEIIESKSYYQYIFRIPGTKTLVRMNVPINEFFTFNHDEKLSELPSWFQELVYKVDFILEKRDRIRRIFKFYNKLTLVAKPNLRLEEAAIPYFFLPRIHPYFTIHDSKEIMKDKLKEFDAKITIGTSNIIHTFTPVLSSSHHLGLHPLICSGFPADFDGEFIQVELKKRM